MALSLSRYHIHNRPPLGQVLGAFEEAGVLPSERPVLTHCQVLGDDLIHRMKIGGVIANVQPSFVPTDMRWVQERLSVCQQQYSYAWKVRWLYLMAGIAVQLIRSIYTHKTFFAVSVDPS